MGSLGQTPIPKLRAVVGITVKGAAGWTADGSRPRSAET